MNLEYIVFGFVFWPKGRFLLRNFDTKLKRGRIGSLAYSNATMKINTFELKVPLKTRARENNCPFFFLKSEITPCERCPPHKKGRTAAITRDDQTERILRKL